MTARATFKQADLDRAVKVFIAHGIPIGGVEITDGKIIVLAGDELKPRRKNKADELYGPQS